MIAPDQSNAKQGGAVAEGTPQSGDLPFRIELWNEEGTKVAQIVARAHGAELARAIFAAACEEYPGRRLILWRGRQRLSEKTV